MPSTVHTGTNLQTLDTKQRSGGRVGEAMSLLQRSQQVSAHTCLWQLRRLDPPRSRCSSPLAQFDLGLCDNGQVGFPLQASDFFFLKGMAGRSYPSVAIISEVPGLLHKTLPAACSGPSPSPHPGPHCISIPSSGFLNLYIRDHLSEGSVALRQCTSRPGYPRMFLRVCCLFPG